MTIITADQRADQLADRARQVRFWRTVLLLITGVFYAVGWVLAKAWFVVVFSGMAVAEGWREGRGGARR